MDPHDLIHGLRDTQNNWQKHRCDYCGRAPKSLEDADNWQPLSGDGWMCGDIGCEKKLQFDLKFSGSV